MRPGVVYIETLWRAHVQDHEGDWLGPYEWTSSCSGFIVNPAGYIVTAGHCVDDGLDAGARGTALDFAVQEWIDQGWISESLRPDLEEVAYATWKVEGDGGGTPPDRTVYVQHGRATSGLRTGEAWPARVVEVKGLLEGDVALLKVEQGNLPVVTLAQDADVSIGTQVMSVGYPASSDMVTDATLEPTYKDGKISSKKTRGDGLLPVYEISAALSGGMSGGPTVNLDGEVIGVNSFSIEGETEAFNFLSPASLVAETLSRNGVDNELGPVDELYRQGVDAFFGGDYHTALERFDQVLDRVPSHQQAQELRTEAVNNGGAEPRPAPAAPAAPAASEGGGVSPVLIGLVVLVVALAVGGGLLAAKRTKRTPSAEAVTPPPAAPPVPTVVANGTDPARFCTKCGTEVAHEARFCPGCGSEVPTPQAV